MHVIPEFKGAGGAARQHLKVDPPMFVSHRALETTKFPLCLAIAQKEGNLQRMGQAKLDN